MPGIRTSISTTSGWHSSACEHGLLAVGGLARDDQVGLGLEDHPEPGADQRLVVDDEDPDLTG